MAWAYRGCYKKGITFNHKYSWAAITRLLVLLLCKKRYKSGNFFIKFGRLKNTRRHTKKNQRAGQPPQDFRKK